MRRPLVLSGFLLLAALVWSCKETITETQQGTFTVSISVADSPFLAAGDTLVGDQVQFEGTVLLDGQPAAASGASFESSNSNIVRILDQSTGEASFTGVGTATVTVTYTQPAVDGSERLQASMNVRVTRYLVDLALISLTSGDTIDASNALVGEAVRVESLVTKESSGDTVPSSGITIVASTDTAVADPGFGGADETLLKAAGTADLAVTIAQPPIPNSPPPLRDTLAVSVSAFAVQIDVASLVDPAFLAAGDTLVTDSVRFSATVTEAGVGDITPNIADWSSSNTSILRFIDSATGEAVFEDTGQVVVSVTFDDPQLPGAPFEDTLRVTTYLTQLDVESLINNGVPLADTLLTDRVQFSATVSATKDGSQVPDSIVTTEASDSTIVNIIKPDSGIVVFADTGVATVRLTLGKPRLPRAILQPQIDLRVATYLAQISQVSPAGTPIMGDTIQYDVVVTYTRDDPPSVVSNPGVAYSTSDASVIDTLDTAAGVGFARDTGQARVSVTVNNPSLPNGTISDSLPITGITEERFYGAFSDSSGTFGLTATWDTVTVVSSAVHKFTDSTRVEFPNGMGGFIDRVVQDTLFFFVPAAADTGQLALRNLVDDQGGFRDSVLTRIVFDGPGTDVVDDFYEPNDTFPLTSSVKISAPFEALQSWDPSKSAPADTNFFYFDVQVANVTFDMVAEWQVDADIDFKVCNATGFGDPPTGYDDAFCPRQIGDNSTNARREEGLGLILSSGRYIIGFYCKAGSCPATLPLTYKVTIQEQ